jgi:SSS family solute:Na+ symporter
MWSVAVTDFIQMIMLVIGPVHHRGVRRATMAGGADKVIALAASKDCSTSCPSPASPRWRFSSAAAVTMMLGSIPQQDVFQRVMSAKNAKPPPTAR